MIAKLQKSKRDSRQAIFFSALIGILVLGIISFLVVSNLKINQRRTELIERIESLRKEIQALDEKNENLRAGISRTQDESYWEEKVREQGYKKPGEEAVVVLPPEEYKEEPNEKEKSFWEKILEKLGF